MPFQMLNVLDHCGHRADILSAVHGLDVQTTVYCITPFIVISRFCGIFSSHQVALAFEIYIIIIVESMRRMSVSGLMKRMSVSGLL